MAGEAEVIDASVTSHDPDSLTAAEQEYLDSGGEKAEGLLAEAGIKPDADAGADGVKDKAADGGEKAKPDAKADAGDKPAAKDAAVDDDDDDEPEQPSKDGRQKTVSFKKFERTRKKLDEQLAAEKTARETAAKQLSELQERFARGDERLKLLTEALAPQPEQVKDEDPEPDATQDIFAHNAWLRRQLGKVQESVAQTRETLSERSQADTLKNEYQADALSFSRETPDFGAAYTHLLNTRGAMLEAQGYDGNQIRQILFNEEKQLVERAKATGKRPAAMVYALAQQLGYRKADPAPVVAAATAAPAADIKPNGNGHTEAKPSVTEEIARIKAGQEAGKSLSGAGGAANELSKESLAAMSDAEFEAFYAKSRGKVEQLLGKSH
jgi:hypothetical protein